MDSTWLLLLCLPLFGLTRSGHLLRLYRARLSHGKAVLLQHLHAVKRADCKCVVVCLHKTLTSRLACATESHQFLFASVFRDTEGLVYASLCGEWLSWSRVFGVAKTVAIFYMRSLLSCWNVHISYSFTTGPCTVCIKPHSIVVNAMVTFYSSTSGKIISMK